MKKKLFLTCFLIFALSCTLVACGGDETLTTDDDTQAASQTTDATGTLVGFADNHTVEITMADGTSQTFLVYNEDIITKLQTYDESNSQEISFGYITKEGQDLQEIISVE